MSDIKQCDVCGKQSPDKRNLYIANAWYKIEVEKMNHADGRYDICEPCYEKIKKFVRETRAKEDPTS